MNKIAAVFLSLFILLSSLNYRLSAHYCGQKLVDLALFGDATACSMQKEKTCDVEKKACCSNQTIIIEGEDFLSSKEFSGVELNASLNLIASLEFPIELFSNTGYTEKLYCYYYPPLIVKQIPIMLQNFLL